MKPEDVPYQWVNKAARAIHEARCCPLDKDSDCHGEPLYVEDDQARHALASVLPDIQAQALRDEADRTYTYHFSTGDRVEQVHGERSRSLMYHEAARLTATTNEGGTNGA